MSGTPDMKMCSDVDHRVGTLNMKMYLDIHTRMGTPHMKMYISIKVVEAGHKNVFRC